jgi:hypothetical protein
VNKPVALRVVITPVDGIVVTSFRLLSLRVTGDASTDRDSPPESGLTRPGVPTGIQAQCRRILLVPTGTGRLRVREGLTGRSPLRVRVLYYY